ncbi:MAG: hypothetical protein AB7P11_21205 [Hydrogenophaga sp.]|uniref:hypothetical protein n=1 Tax=Hydrogenophaga sp. TaxID=1904254 RepID=UPI003D13FECB
MSETKAIVLQPPGPITPAPSRAATMAVAFAGLMPTSIGEAFTLATYLAKSNVIPKSLRQKPESVMAVVMAGMELGLTPMRALQSITIISGNMAMKTDLQLALVRRSGFLAYHDEGFELRGETDGTLPARAKDGAKIVQLVAHVPTGKPYGWCTVQRTGEDQLRTYVFSWVDADRVLASEYEDDDDGGSGRQRVTKKLSEKHNYKNYPQSMYPRRARGAVLQVVFGDVLAGLPAVEALEGGQVLNAEYSTADDHDDVDGLLAQIADEDAELATGITAGFEHLQMGKARQLQMLVQFKGNARGLYDKLRTETANRKGMPEAPPKKKAAASHPPAQPQPEGAPEPAQATPAPAVVVDPAPAPPAPPVTSLADLAAQFKGGAGTDGGASF